MKRSDMTSLSSAFASPTGVVAITQAQASQQAERPVASEAELRRAIGELAARFNINQTAGFGGGILLTGPFTIRSTIIIPERCPGLTIRAAGRFPIRAGSTALAAMFDVRAEMVTIRDLLVYGDTAGYFTTFVTIGSTFSAGRSANNCRLLHNDLFVDRIFVDSGGEADESLIEGNRQVEANASHSATISTTSPRVRIVNNPLLSDGGGDTVTLGALAANCVVAGNDLNGGDVTSSASDGGNRIYGNTNPGTITPHATDGVWP